MEYLEWSDNFSVKVKELDDQHRTLVSMINALHRALLAHRGGDAKKEIVDRMVDYARTHFETEEAYMKKFGFSAYETHKAEHDKFAANALELQARMGKGSFVLTLGVLNFLKDWLQKHILGTDKKYVEHFNKHGLA